MSMLEQHEQQQQEQQLLLMTEASAAPTQHHQQQQFDSSSGAALMCEPSAALSTGGYSMVSQGNRWVLHSMYTLVHSTQRSTSSARPALSSTILHVADSQPPAG